MHHPPRLGRRYLSYIPAHEKVIESDLSKLQDMIDQASKVVVLTGAGISTESGIPDYRSEGVGLDARSNHRRIQHQDFMTQPDVHETEYHEIIRILMMQS
jgi:NAD-dependent deacetylase sirtuin 4